jgi:hypothetical protein
MTVTATLQIPECCGRRSTPKRYFTIALVGRGTNGDPITLWYY